MAFLIVVEVLSAVAACAAEISFDAEIRPIFAEHCVACHGGVKQAGGLSFIYRDNVLAGGESGAPAVTPGDLANSYLIDRITDEDPDFRMPPAEHGRALSTEEIDKLKQWITAGANWEPPWAFVPPEKAPLPAVRLGGWKPLDHFIHARLESAGLAPAAEADRAEWLRRVSFDLVGLPPSLKEIDEFINDVRPDAYERVVDRLLASPHFGERWAAMWLDVARYADTTGYERDPHRDIWPYRDWVIRAFNADMPFDEFTIAQLAGDLLESPSLDDLVATAFHRNTQTNTEGGTDDEEFRTAAVLDRVNTTWQVWQATTFGCTQCHAHPYEPIRHEEYYQFFAFFNNTRDSDIDEEFPLLSVPLSREDDAKRMEALRQMSHLKRRLHSLVLPQAQALDTWRNLPIDSAHSTGETVLRVEYDDSQRTEVWVDGAATLGSAFTLESPIPKGIEQITALRIDALLRNLKAAKKNPEHGFILSRLKVELLPPVGKPQELKFEHAFSDEPEPVLDPQDSLDDNDFGWGSYSHQWKPQFAVFLLKNPVIVPPGSRLRIVLNQKRGTTGDIALVLNRSRYAVSSGDEWQRIQESAEFNSAQRELAELKKQDTTISSTSIPVLQELSPDRSRSTFVFERGLWLDKGARVQAGVPASLPPLPTSGPHDRLEMAQWLVSDDNPLTARVIVNRIWAELFGSGIVETVDNFGVSGTTPSHPELLDYLAVTFRDDMRWSIKKLLREIVLSSTYRQSARITPAAVAHDPQNRLLSRGPRNRLSAEMVRDQALFVSGKLSSKMFGPPVMPPQPEGIWRSVYNDAKWINATDENRYRRAIYTYWKRTSGYPSMMAFDMPSREVCTGQRISTNTPLQALVTLNDEAYIELAQAFTDRMENESSGDVPEKLAWAYRTASGTEPTAEVLEELVHLYEKTLNRYQAEPANEQQSNPQQAALAVVANTILNLDAVLNK